MEYYAGHLTITPQDVARLFAAAVRSLQRWQPSSRRAASSLPASFAHYSRLYADMSKRELATARSLLRQHQIRAAGAVAGVALEFHLKHVAAAHQILIGRAASVTQLEGSLRHAGLLGPQQRRAVQKLTGIRNQCVHGRDHVPSRTQIEQLIQGVEELRRTLR